MDVSWFRIGADLKKNSELQATRNVFCCFIGGIGFHADLS